MSIQGFMVMLDAELTKLEFDLANTKIPKNQDQIQKRIDELRVLRSRALPWMPTTR